MDIIILLIAVLALLVLDVLANQDGVDSRGDFTQTSTSSYLFVR